MLVVVSPLKKAAVLADDFGDGVTGERFERGADEHAIKQAVAGTLANKGMRFRAINDEAGDAAIALVFYANDAHQASWIAEALEAEGVGASTLYDPNDVDYHVYTHWQPIVHKRAWSEPSNPWSWHGGDLDYSPAACPHTLDLLSRAVHLNISPELTSAHIEEIAEAIVKVVGR